MLSVLLALAVAPVRAEPPVVPICGELPKAFASPLAVPTLEDTLSAGVGKMTFYTDAVPGAVSVGKASIAAVKNKHLFAPIGLPLGQGPRTHLAAYFSGDKKLRLAV